MVGAGCGEAVAATTSTTSRAVALVLLLLSDAFTPTVKFVPGRSVFASCTKFRPFNGRLDMAVLLMTCPTEAFSVCSNWALPTTSTRCSRVPSSMVKSSLASWLTCNSNPR